MTTTALRRSNSGGDLSKESLRSFLDDGTAKKKKGGAATVAGDATDSDVYIRPDGKKVRRVKKVVRKTQAVEGLGGFLNDSAGRVKKGSSATVGGELSSSSHGEIYIRPDGKKVRRIKKTISKRSLDDGGEASAGSTSDAKSSLSGFLDSNTVVGKKMSGSATVGGDRVSKEESEIIVRADGKKVRRIKKTVVRSKSGRHLVSDAASIGGGEDEDQPCLGSFLDAAPPKKKLGGSATVTGVPALSSSKASLDGDVYINAEGKKVRRVKRTKSGGSAALLAAMNKSAGDLSSMLDAAALDKPKKGSSATVTGDGEVYIRADGKKVRRIKKAASADEDDLPKSKSLEGFLDCNKPAIKKMSGSATVGGDRVTKEETEVYIRADGKKVRRVKRTVSRSKSGDLNAMASALTPTKPAAAAAKEDPATPATAASTPDSAEKSNLKSPPPESAPSTPETAKKPGLGGFIAATSPVKKKAGASATVTGGKVEGEIYINAEGKRVRRVRRSKADSSSSNESLGGFLDSAPKLAKKGPASVAGDSPSKQAKKYTEGEIYIRADGKKVRRVKKSSLEKPSSVSLSAMLDSKPAANKKSGSATVAGDQVVKQVPEGEIIIRADGKKVLRRKKAPTASQAEEGEVYRRADGKLVRRVKRKPASAAGDLAGFLDKDEDKKEKNAKPSGSATVAGDAPTKSAATKAALTDLLKTVTPRVAVVERPTTPLTANLSDSSSGHAKEELKAEEKTSAASQASTMSSTKLSPSDEEIAASYRKMAKMGLPRDAVRHKMLQDGVNVHIIAAVFDGDAAESSASTPSATSSEPAAAPAPLDASSLTADEVLAVERYRKMTKMGMPMPAVEHRMAQDGADPRLIPFVEADEFVRPSPSPAAVPAAAPVPAPDASGLTEDEVAAVIKYRKMTKMGMPPPSVEHKMTQDGADSKLIPFVMADDFVAPAPSKAPAPTPAPLSTPDASGLTEDEVSAVIKYRKMTKMGMPPPAVEHKMVQDGADPKLIPFVMADDFVAPAPSPAAAAAPASPPDASGLTEDDVAAVIKYRKMTTMGMPPPAVEHKMVQDGADPKLIPFVMADEFVAPEPSRGPAPVTLPAAAPVPPPSQGAATPNAVAYIVVVSDGEKANGGAGQPSVPASAVATPDSLGIKPDEKFAVSVGSKKDSAAKETKFMTLDDIAKMSGQSKDELAKMVHGKRSRDESPPRFVLQPMDKQSGELFEVEVGGGSGSGSTPSAANAPAGATLAPVSAGQEVVSSDLANAARAVSALGTDDMAALLAKLQSGDMGALIERLKEAEKRQKKLEKQLAQAGVAIAEDIDYSEALAKVEFIARRMNEIGGSDVVLPDKEEQNKLREEYFKLEQEMERYNTALVLTDEYQAEQARKEKEWEDSNRAENLEALKKIRRHMPVMIRHMSEAELTNNPSPNGKFLPKTIAKKFKRTNVLQCIRLNPDDLERMHPSTLENMRVTGLTLTERRALYCHLAPLGPRWEKNKAEKMTERKWTWYQMMKNNFKENLAPYQRHVDQYGPPHNHVGCPLLGKQCPIKADLLIDYNNDFGYTDADQYEVSDVKKADVDDPGAKAMQEALELAREKKANERADLLKKHYKGKLLQVSKANGSCEAMDESMDKMESHVLKWAEFMLSKGKDESDDDKKKEVANFTDALNEFKLALLDFAQRSGMQTSGAKKKSGDEAPDPRSLVEASLSEEVYEAWQQMASFIQDRMKEIGIKDTRIEKTVELLNGMFSELHGRNLTTIEALGGKRMDRSRKLKTNADIKKDAEEKLKPKEEEKPPEEAPAGLPPGHPMAGRGGGGRGGFLDAIQGRGRGPPGRGGLLDAIKGGGRGRGPPGGGRGGLLDAIQARGSGRGGGGGGDGARGGLLAAIQGRGRGGPMGGDGRGGLLAAIQARGGGGD